MRDYAYSFFFDGLSSNYGMRGHVSDATRSTETSLKRVLQEKRIMLEQNEFRGNMPESKDRN